MSYDILLYPRTAGQTWDEVLAADEEETPDSITGDERLLAEGVELFGRIEERVVPLLAGGIDTWTAEETGGDVIGEVAERESGLKVELFHGSAAVSFPGSAEEHPGLAERVRDVVQAVADETGFEAYDVQARQSFEGVVPGVAGAGAAGSVGGDSVGANGAASGAGGSSAGQTPEGPMDALRRSAAQRTPQQVRRRGIFDLILGSALVIYHFWRRNEGDGGIIMTIILVLGVMNLFAGFMSLMTARRLQANQDASGTTPGAGPGSAAQPGTQPGTGTGSGSDDDPTPGITRL